MFKFISKEKPGTDLGGSSAGLFQFRGLQRDGGRDTPKYLFFFFFHGFLEELLFLLIFFSNSYFLMIKDENKIKIILGNQTLCHIEHG